MLGRFTDCLLCGKSRGLSEATNATKAAESAHRHVETMLPGSPHFAALSQLAMAHKSSSHKEDVFVKHVLNLGEALPVGIEEIFLRSLNKKQHCVPIRPLAEYILQHYPGKLLAGNTSLDDGFHQEMLHFWEAFRLLYPEHDVFSKFRDELHLCIPCKVHSDEGTGLRRAAVNQISWGPVISSLPNSLDRYFFWSSMNGEEYKAANAGYERGNEILDELHSHLALQMNDVFLHGIVHPTLGVTVRLVWIALEGDLPAQARSLHCKRNFNCVPNQLCPWCLADDGERPFADHRLEASWRSTVGASRPWNTPSPFNSVPGGNHELFLAKDLFHLCHLGAIRGFAINVLCYLTFSGAFAACQKS